MVQVREKWGKKMQLGERIMLKQKLGLELKMPVFLITLESLLMVLKYIKKCQRGCHQISCDPAQFSLGSCMFTRNKCNEETSKLIINSL